MFMIMNNNGPENNIEIIKILIFWYKFAL